MKYTERKNMKNNNINISSCYPLINGLVLKKKREKILNSIASVRCCCCFSVWWFLSINIILNHSKMYKVELILYLFAPLFGWRMSFAFFLLLVTVKWKKNSLWHFFLSSPMNKINNMLSISIYLNLNDRKRPIFQFKYMRFSNKNTCE